MKFFRKKGTYTYWTILWLLMYMGLSAIFINVHMTNEVHRRVVLATDEAARERARAIDTFLKEQEGVIEIFHSDTMYDENIQKYALSKEQVYVKMVDSHTPPKKPGTIDYTNSLNKADNVAKVTVVDYLNTVLHKNLNGEDILKNFSSSNICTDVQSLPADTDWNKKRNFSCTTSLGEIDVDDVVLSSVEENTVVIYDKDGVPNNGDEQKIHVLNVAFVGVAYEQYYFLSNLLEKMGISPTAINHTWALAYPQVDKCYEGALTCS